MPDYIEDHAVEIDHKRFAVAVAELASRVDSNASEPDLQSFLEAHPYILSQQFSHCHHVFPKVRLGTQYEADFLCLDIPSSGYEWRAIELESPEKKVMTKAGRKTAQLEHALQQIRDWRSWVTQNLTYARNATSNNGLGLKDIQPHIYGYVIIGRRNSRPEGFNQIRAQVLRDEQLDIRSWDGIVEWAGKRASIFSNRLQLQEEIATKESELQEMKTRLDEFSSLVRDADLVCERCGAALTQRVAAPRWGHYHGREIEYEVELTMYECGRLLTDGVEETPCRV